MTDGVLLSVPRRKLLAGFGFAAIGGATGRAIGSPVLARSQEKSGAVAAKSFIPFQ